MTPHYRVSSGPRESNPFSQLGRLMPEPVGQARNMAACIPHTRGHPNSLLAFLGFRARSPSLAIELFGESTWESSPVFCLRSA